MYTHDTCLDCNLHKYRPIFTISFRSNVKVSHICPGCDKKSNMVHCFLRPSVLGRCVAADAGIKAESCSMCTGESCKSFFKPSAASNSTEVPGSSYSYGCRKWSEQTVSTLLPIIETLHLIKRFIQ